MPTCQECNTPLVVEDAAPELGDIVTCSACGAEHEVISADPLQLELIEEEK